MKESSLGPRWQPHPQDLIVNDLYDKAAKHPDHVAVSRRIDDAWTDVTCRALADDVEALAAGLISAGIEAGERVALMSKTRYEWLLYDMAILSIGAVTVPIYETSSAEQVEWILTDSGAVAAIVESDQQEQVVTAMRDRLPGLRELWRLEPDRFRLVEAGFGIGPEIAATRRETMGPENIATLVYTSGTTGRPKGCVLTHGNLLALVNNVLAADGIHSKVFNDEQSTLLFLPLAHILARTIQMSALHAGVRLGHTDMSNVVADLQSFRPTVVLSVPRVFEKLYNGARHAASAGGHAALFDRAERVAVAYSKALESGGPSMVLKLDHALFDRLVYRKVTAAMGGRVRWAVSGGAPLGSHLGHVFRGMGITVLEGYGLTESTAGGTLNLPGQQRVGSVGPAIPGCTLRIADDGEILMKGPHVFSGYWHNDEATAEILHDGWLSTGDVGHLDEDGYLYITDRKKDLLVTSAGKNVAPSQLEDRLRSHWMISQALVVGDAKPYVAALLTLDTEAFTTWKADAGKAADADLPSLLADDDLGVLIQEAVDAANASVSQAEAIKRWHVLPQDFTIESGDVTPTLKLRRSLVVERYADAVAQLYS